MTERAAAWLVGGSLQRARAGCGPVSKRWFCRGEGEEFALLWYPTGVANGSILFPFSTPVAAGVSLHWHPRLLFAVNRRGQFLEEPLHRIAEKVSDLLAFASRELDAAIQRSAEFRLAHANRNGRFIVRYSPPR